MSGIKRILVVARMIQTCRPAIHSGVELARSLGAELYIIHSIYNPFGLKGWSLGTMSLAKEYDQMMDNTRQALAEIVEEEKAKGTTIKEIVRDGEPTEEILKTIEEEKIDLVVTLAHEEGFLENLLFNSSNVELVRKMPCSILLVKKEPESV